MRGAARAANHYSVEEYLDAERVAEERHEYLAGAIYAMAGTSVAHGRIAGNISRELGNQLRGKRCEVFFTEIKVRIRKDGGEFFYYPDVIVDCGKGEGSSLFADDPRVIFEVLSRETERTDRGEKRANYQAIPSLDAYVLVDQYQVAVTVYRREGDEWRQEFLTETTRELVLPSIECTLPLALIYERTKL